MKTNVHYSNIKTIKPVYTNMDFLKAFGKLLGLFFVSVIILAGVDLIDQLLLWLK